MAGITWQLLRGDARERLKDIAENSIHCVVTSPPFWGLRDYGTAVWEGGKEGCKHEVPLGATAAKWKQITNVGSHKMQYDEKCKCGAIKLGDLQIGLEKTPTEYVEEIVNVFREVKRVLRPDGVCWLNLGDSYVSTPRGNENGWEGSTLHGIKSKAYQSTLNSGTATSTNKTKVPGLKAKDLVGIPWRVAFALQADGWYLRSDIIWSKPNPMPESVTDRPTKAHEYIFMLTKSPTYFYDWEAIKEKSIGDWNSMETFGTERAKLPDGEVARAMQRTQFAHLTHHDDVDRFFRNKRTVWEIATQPYKEAHFATFPELLVNPCIKASTSEEGCCPTCGAQWERFDGGDAIHAADPNVMDARAAEINAARSSGDARHTTVGWWTRTCEHREEPIPCTVLDPFNGSGTTGVAALKLKRSYIGVELSEEYADMSEKRLKDTMPLFSKQEIDDSEPNLFAEGG